MKIFVKLIFFTFISLLSLSCFSKTEVEPAVAEIISSVQKATDPEGITLKMKTKFQKGVVDMPAQKFKANTEVLYSYPDKCRIYSKLSNGQEAVQVVNGDKAWEIKDGKVRIINGEELSYLIFNIKLDSFRANWKTLFKKIILEKDQKVDGKLCYVIKCIPEVKYNIKTDVVFYIDKKSYLVLRTDMSAYSQAGILREKIYVLNYENMSGVMVPEKTETDIFGAKIVYTVTEVKFNKSVDSSKFQLPKN